MSDDEILKDAAKALRVWPIGFWEPIEKAKQTRQQKDELADRLEAIASRLPRYTIIRGRGDWPPVGMVVVAKSRHWGLLVVGKVSEDSLDGRYITDDGSDVLRLRDCIWWTPAPTGPEVRDE